MAYGGGIGNGCLTNGRMTMRATLLHQNDNYSPYPVDPEDYGTWVDSQDPLTGEIIRVWNPFEVTPDNPDTPDVNEAVYREIPCIARGIVDGGIRVAGTTERFGDTYENIDYVKMWVPPSVRITKRDRITNIKDLSGHIRWRDEEFEPLSLTNPVDMENPEVANRYLKATVFNVNGVTPLFNAFNQLSEQFVLLERVTTPQEQAEEIL